MNEFNIGDKVICIGGFVSNDNLTNGGGYGYKKGRTFIITDMGAISKALRKVSPIKPIKKLITHKI